MRDNAVGDVDGEVIGRIACASLRYENEVPGSVIGRAGLRDGSQGKRACDRRAKQEPLHHRFSEALAMLVMSPSSVLHLQIHQLGMRHHILVQVGHDHERSCEDEEHDEHAKRERQDVVGAVRSGRDVKKEYQVHAHLGDGENGEAGRHARCPDHRGVCHPEGRDRKNHSQ